MSATNEQETARQAVAEFAPEFSVIATRAERCRVDTRDGRKIFDLEVREEYAEAEKRMNHLLKVLKLAMPLVEVVDIEIDIEQKPVDIELTTVRFQLPHETVPEFHDSYIIVMDDEDLGRGRKFDV